LDATLLLTREVCQMPMTKNWHHGTNALTTLSPLSRQSMLLIETIRKE
jgi:hypothetical protein